MDQTNYSGKYFRTSYGDIKSSKGWFGKICLLGLISFIPIFGQMTVYGYAWEWAHKAAWGVESPMPKKIYGRPGSKMLRWGWFALVIAIVMTIIPGIVLSVGGWFSSMGMETGIYTATGRYMVVTPGNFAFAGIGWILYVAGIVLAVFASIMIWVGTIRMTMYDRLGTGLQFGKIWTMIKKDFGGLMRIFGMAILFDLVGGIIIGIVALIIVVAVLGATVAPLIFMSSNGMYSDSAMFGYVLTLIMTMFPVVLVLSYVWFVYSAFIELLVARAVGYWTRQFDVSAWGTKDDPLPFEVAGGQPDAPRPPHAPAASGDMPAPPTGEPVNVATPQPASAAAPEVPAALNPMVVAEALDVEPELPASDGADDNVSDEATHVDVVDPELAEPEEAAAGIIAAEEDAERPEAALEAGDDAKDADASPFIDDVDPDLVVSEEDEMTERQSEDKL